MRHSYIWAFFSACAISLTVACQTAAPEAPPPTKFILPTPRPEISSQTPIAVQPAVPTLDVSVSDFLEIESAFSAGDCVRVLQKWRSHSLPETERRLLDTPTSIAVPVALCAAQMQPSNSDRIDIATKVLERAEQRSFPLLDHARLSRLTADFHMSKGNLDAAASASLREREYLAQSVKQLAAITATTPSTPTQEPNSNVLSTPTTTPPIEANSVDKSVTDARAALNSGDPQTAVSLLDAIPEHEKNDRIKRLRKEAAEAHVRDLRTKAREFYLKAQAQANKPQKIEILKQSLAINEEILSKYEDTASRPGVERSIRSIKSEIDYMNRGK